MLVAGKELRETLRDRRTIAVMVLFPLVVYPLVSLVTAQVLAARVARVDAHVARVAVEGPPALVAPTCAACWPAPMSSWPRRRPPPIWRRAAWTRSPR